MSGNCECDDGDGGGDASVDPSPPESSVWVSVGGDVKLFDGLLERTVVGEGEEVESKVRSVAGIPLTLVTLVPMVRNSIRSRENFPPWP